MQCNGRLAQCQEKESWWLAHRSMCWQSIWWWVRLEKETKAEGGGWRIWGRYGKVSPSENSNSVTSQSFSLFLPASSALPMLSSPNQGALWYMIYFLHFFVHLSPFQGGQEFKAPQLGWVVSWGLDNCSVHFSLAFQLTLLLLFNPSWHRHFPFSPIHLSLTTF